MTRTTAAAQRAGLGEYGERVAARHLREQGMALLDQNWRCEQGEIDLVLRDGDTLVICEVKTRTSLDHGSPHEAVDEVKLARLRRLGRRWIETHGIEPPETRIDLVAVLRPRRGPTVIEHVAGLA